MIIIDEGLYVLDKRRRDIIYKFLEDVKQNKIIIVITHNDNELQNADVEYSIIDGNVI